MSQLILVTLLAMGCETPKDVSRTTVFKTDYQSNQVYETQCLLFIGNGYLLKVMAGSTPQSISEFNREKDAWKAVGIDGFLPENTQLRICQIIYRKSFEMGRWFTIGAEVLNGNEKGRIVDVNFISVEKEQENPRVRVPNSDPKFLKLVK